MKLLFKILSFIVIGCIIYLSMINSSVELAVRPFDSRTVSFTVYSILVLVLGILAGAMYVGQFYLNQKDKVASYKRELEKSNLDSSSNESKVEVLEAKIATLEKALDDALNK